MDLDRAQADWTLGRFPSGNLPELAAQMMMQGHDGPAILALASFHRPGPWDVPRDLVDRAFQECGRPPLDVEEAACRLVERVLRTTADPARAVPPIAEVLRGRCWCAGLLNDLCGVCDFWCWGEDEPDLRRDAESRWPSVVAAFLKTRR